MDQHGVVFISRHKYRSRRQRLVSLSVFLLTRRLSKMLSKPAMRKTSRMCGLRLARVRARPLIDQALLGGEEQPEPRARDIAELGEIDHARIVDQAEDFLRFGDLGRVESAMEVDNAVVVVRDLEHLTLQSLGHRDPHLPASRVRSRSSSRRPWSAPGASRVHRDGARRWPPLIGGAGTLGGSKGSTSKSTSPR